MKRNCQPKKAGPLTAAVCLAALGVGVFASLAHTFVKTESEPWIAPARAARKQNPIPADAKSVAQGKELFAIGCLPCHGPAGKGDGPAAPTLERNGAPIRPGNLSNSKLWEQTDGTLFGKIGEGKSPMPSLQETWSDEQRWQIVNYVRTLALRVGNTNQEPNAGGK